MRGCPFRLSGKHSFLTRRKKCYNIAITVITKDGGHMILSIDFNSDEAFYIQLRNQIIIGIATEGSEREILCRLCASWRIISVSICIQ